MPQLSSLLTNRFWLKLTIHNQTRISKNHHGHSLINQLSSSFGKLYSYLKFLLSIRSFSLKTTITPFLPKTQALWFTYLQLFQHSLHHVTLYYHTFINTQTIFLVALYTLTKFWMMSETLMILNMPMQNRCCNDIFPSFFKLCGILLYWHPCVRNILSQCVTKCSLPWD